MSGSAASRLAEVSRRRVLVLASAAVGLAVHGLSRPSWAATPRSVLPADDPARLAPFERLHFPALQLPLVTTNGAKVPVAIEMAHPMEPGHYTRSIHLVNERDPVPSKGVFHFTPANGQVYLVYQVRLDAGLSELSVTAECNLHGQWSRSRSVNVPLGAGGCAAPAPPGRTAGPDILPPRIRIPILLKGGRIRPNEIIDVQLTMRHPNRTGLAFRSGTFVQESEPFHLADMEVVYGAEPVSRFAMTSALSDDPFITFRLRPHREGLLRVVLSNTRGQRFEATHPLRFG